MVGAEVGLSEGPDRAWLSPEGPAGPAAVDPQPTRHGLEDHADHHRRCGASMRGHAHSAHRRSVRFESIHSSPLCSRSTSTYTRLDLASPSTHPLSSSSAFRLPTSPFSHPPPPRLCCFPSPRGAAVVEKMSGSRSTLTYEEVAEGEYVFPGDWVAHSTIWLSWQAEDHKRGYPVHQTQLQMIGGLHGHQSVALLVQDDAEQRAVVAAAAQARVPLDHVTFHAVPHVGLWMRDMGPQFSYSLSSRQLGIVDWNFNQWGHEEPTDPDSALNQRVHQQLSVKLGVPLIPVASSNGVQMIHEGGGVAHNGRGTMIAVESVAMQRNLGPHRFFKGTLPPDDDASPTSYAPSPEWDACRQQLETEYLRSLRVRKLIWVPTGVYEDTGTFRGPIARQFHVPQFEGHPIQHAGVYPLYTTNGHGDEFVKFVTEDTVVVTQCEQPSAAVQGEAGGAGSQTPVLEQLRAYIERLNYERMERAATILSKATTAEGRPIRVIRVPSAPLLFTVMQPGDPIYDYFASYQGWVHPERDAIKPGDAMLAVLPTSYINYLATADVVLVARYWREGRPQAMKRNEEEAWRIIGAQYPDRTLVPIDIESVNMGGGGIHCSSQQQPA